MDREIIPAAGQSATVPRSNGRTRSDGAPPGGAGNGMELAAQRPAAIAAEWALWGKEGHETGDHVLRFSNGPLRARDFGEVVTRYSPGELDELPQYTVGWIPGAKGEPEYVALGIHEAARDDDDRSRRDAAGRLIVYVRLFCLRYADLARHAVSYLDLVQAAEHVRLPADHDGPVTLILPGQAAPRRRRQEGFGRLPDRVATTLLTSHPICVLGADDVPVAERLRFIDAVMALLPYGLRATMSAGTWADSTSQDLKLRLFFSGTPQAGDNPKTVVVHWTPEPGPVEYAGKAAQLYREWLKDHRAKASALLAEQGHPVRFSSAGLLRMIGNLPNDKGIAETLDGVGNNLASKDRAAVKEAVKRLQRYLAGDHPPVSLVDYQRKVRDRELLADHAALASSPLKGELYDALLQLAFGFPLTYEAYCAVEECAGVPLHDSLRAALARAPAVDSLAWILMHESRPGFRSDKSLTALHRKGAHPREPLADLVSAVERQVLRPDHGPVLLDFALRYLRDYSDNATETLIGLGCLAWEHEYIFRDDWERIAQLGRALDVAFPGQLSRPEIDYIFRHSPRPPTVALEEAVARKTGRRNRQYVANCANAATRRYQGFPQRPLAARRKRLKSWARRLRWGGGGGPQSERPPPEAAALSLARPPAATGSRVMPEQPATKVITMSAVDWEFQVKPLDSPNDRVLSRVSVWEHPRVILGSVAFIALLVLATLLILRYLLLHA